MNVSVSTAFQRRSKKGWDMYKASVEKILAVFTGLFFFSLAWTAEDFPKPYALPCTERENIFEFTEKPNCRIVGDDRYEISFAVKGYCDVTVGLIDAQGQVVRHLAAGVLGRNAPEPFQKNTLKQKIFWDGKDDLENYVREPGKLRVRVMLGLKPEFDKRLGGTDGRNLPGYVFGMAVGADAAYVFAKGHGNHGSVSVRKFDRDGKYLLSLIPPPANIPLENLNGYGYVEYEKGVRAVHSINIHETCARNGFLLPDICGKGAASCRLALVGNRLYYLNAGKSLLSGVAPSLLHYLITDGSSELVGLKGRPFAANGGHFNPRIAASPDGKKICMVGLEGGSGGNAPVVLVADADGHEPAKILIGGKPGSDPQSLNNPTDIGCDAQGRIYVADQLNNRIQIFSPDGKFLKTIACERAHVLGVHQKTGAIYVKHAGRVEGKTVDRLTKFKSFDEPTAEFHMDGYPAGLMAVDSWSAKPRIWLAGAGFESNTAGVSGKGPGVTIWEEDGKGWKKIADFDEEAKKEAGEQYLGRFSGIGATGGDKVVCDPLREKLYYRGRIFDLNSGKILGNVRLPYSTDDFVFDKRGYMHCHFNPGFYVPGVGRLDPSFNQEGGIAGHPEVPYDYGEEAVGRWNQQWKGILPVKDQPGAKFFQDGIGVNMRGDVAVQSNIYYVPKMEDAGVAFARAGINDRLQRGEYHDTNEARRFERHIEELKRKGEDIYSIKRTPGVSLHGGMVWTFDYTGELRQECAVNAGLFVNGVQIDEEGKVYLVNSRTRVFDGRPFLDQQAGIIGEEAKLSFGVAFTGTLMKTAGKDVKILSDNAVIPLDPKPDRPQVLRHGAVGSWTENVEWLYAGASPIVSGGCSCPKQLFHADWYKRTFVPEAYRHSLGVVDANGNLIMHLGRYGNFDSGEGAKSKIPVGGDNIACFMPRFISGSDNYLAFDDRGERLVVLRLAYHTEETVPIQTR
jgi:hypothetical protein